jgi:hypothetical protein
VRFGGETLPDNTFFKAADGPQTVPKSWTLINAGSTVWEPGQYSLRFVGETDTGDDCLGSCTGGDTLEALEVVPIETSVAPGEQVTLTVSLTVPQTAGEYRGSWRMFNEQEQKYFGDCVWFWIHVAEGALAECPSERLGSIAAGDMVQSTTGQCPNSSWDNCGWWWRCECTTPNCTEAEQRCALPPSVSPQASGANIHPLDCGGSGGSGGGSGSGGSSGSSGSSGSGGSGGDRPLLPQPDPPPSGNGLCWSATLAEWVPPGTCVQVMYASGGEDQCGWRQCKPGEYWDAVQDADLSSCTSVNANSACTECTGDTCPSECTPGTSPLPAATSACTSAVCATAAGQSCCAADGAWDAECVGIVETMSGSCRGACYDSEAENTCGHSECVPGAKLDAACSPCATSVCARDKFCCESEWDVICATITAKRDPYCWCPG